MSECKPLPMMSSAIAAVTLPPVPSSGAVKFAGAPASRSTTRQGR